MNLLGLHYHAIDPKGRIIVPSRLRDVLELEYQNARVMISAWEGVLYIYPVVEYQAIENFVAGLDEFNPMFQRYRRTFVACAVEGEVDKQGRLQIPQEMRVKARLERDIVIVGNIKAIEVWDRQRWDQYCAESESMASDINAQLSLARKQSLVSPPRPNGSSGDTTPSSG